jgi:tripartite-type tricarboxylate transporter receptor subunit TctC
LNSLLKTLLVTLLPALSIVGGGAVSAQEKVPLKIVVGFPPGGSADILARVVAEKIRVGLDRPVVVENKPGAGGRIAVDFVKAAAPDGNTVLLAPMGPFVLFPHTFKKLNYDTFSDFTPVSLVANFQFSVTSGPASGSKTIADLISKSKSDPKMGNYGTAGGGTVPHFIGIMLADATGAQLTHVPFQGGAPAVTALLGGHVAYVIDTITESLELHRTGKGTIVAVSGATRAPQLPDVPTLKEQGVNMEAAGWFAMFGPAKLPSASAARIAESVNSAFKDEETRARLLKLGYETVGGSPAQLAATHRADYAKWEKPIKASGFTAD